MKTPILVLSTSLLATSAFASEWQPLVTNYQSTVLPTKSVSAEYVVHQGKFAGDIDADLEGLGLVFTTMPYQDGFWGKLEFLHNNEYKTDYYEFSFGGHTNFYQAYGIYALASLGMGIGLGQADGLDDTAYFTIPLGLEAGYSPVPNLSIYGGVGYKWAWEISSGNEYDDDRWCRDGDRRRRCLYGEDYHGIGDFRGVMYRAGFRYNF